MRPGDERAQKSCGAGLLLTSSTTLHAGGTRTCIHTPGAALAPEEIGSSGLIGSALEGAALVYFDGRLTEAAMLLATQAR